VGQAVAADVWLDPGLAGPEDDPDLACQVECDVAGCLALRKAPPVASDE